MLLAPVKRIRLSILSKARTSPPQLQPLAKPWSEEDSKNVTAQTLCSMFCVPSEAVPEWGTNGRTRCIVLGLVYRRYCTKEFARAAERLMSDLMTAQQGLYTSRDPPINYYSFLDKQSKDSYGGRKEADSVSFIHTQMEPRMQAKAQTNQEAGFGVNVLMSTDDDFMNIIGETKPTFVMFYASWCGHCSTVKPAFSRLATKMKGEGNPVQVIAIDAAENPKTADFAGIEILPTFKIFASAKMLAVYDGDRSYENMEAFCRSHLKG